MTHLKFGIISEIDADSGMARVYFEEDDFVSAPLKISVMRSKGDQVSFPFDINEHVWCIMDEYCEYGVIGGAIYDDENKPQGSAAGKLLINFADNSAIEYDRQSHTLSFDIQGEVNINCTQANITADETNITAANTNIDGILNVTGAANISGVVSMGGLSGMNGNPIPGSTAELQVKSVTAADDVSAGNISLKNHKHTSASPGSPTSQSIP